VKTVRQIVAQRRPDLIHVNLFRSGLVARIVGRLDGIPVIDSFVSDSYGEVRYSGLSKKRRAKLKVVQGIDVLTARLVDRFVANSHAVARSNATALRVNPDRISVIHRGRDSQAFEPGNALPVKWSEEMGQPTEGCPVFLNVGRLLESKGQADLLQAFPLVLKRRPDAHLVIAGEGGFRTELNQLRDALGLQERVHLLGRRPDVPSLLAAADVFVFPSHFEGHSGALLEAMFAQKPIVATDIPENQESVEHGRTALLVPSGEPAVLAKAMLQMLDEPHEAERLAATAREIALERFDIKRIAEQHEELYRSVLKEKKSKHLK
jgi:glycosyltransferase involved in cell wall biosynthesis